MCGMYHHCGFIGRQTKSGHQQSKSHAAVMGHNCWPMYVTTSWTYLKMWAESMMVQQWVCPRSGNCP
eukprot:3287269-Amphidinium_carterae.2